jgi:formylmethanofuran dehydrogenase subunit E
MALTLISEEDGYSVNEDEHGDEVLIATTPPFARVVVRWEDFDLSDAWQYATRLVRDESWFSRPNRFEFAQELHLAVADPESIDVVWCQSCEEPTRETDALLVDGGEGWACESCYSDNYSTCSDCDNVVHDQDTNYIHGETVCTRCTDRYYSFCEDCDCYYHDDYAEDHTHGGCDCESPQQVFQMRNDGEPVLNQDERVTIALPSGVISPEGIQQIVQLISKQAYTVERPVYHPENYSAYRAADEERCKWWNLANKLEAELGAEWQTREGNYTKRLSKLAYKSQGLKIPPAVLSQVGCIARDNSTGVDFEIEVTRNLNLSAEEFYHEDSCWWQSYSESRCSLKSNGGIGMRTFSQWGYVTGRAWIMPLKLDEFDKFQPTFDSLTPDAFMIFNGYGDLSGYTPARIMAHMAGMTYRKVEFDCSPMYVNNGNGYLVTSEEIAAKYPAGSRVSLYTDTHSTLHHDEAKELVAA